MFNLFFYENKRIYGGQHIFWCIGAEIEKGKKGKSKVKRRKWKSEREKEKDRYNRGRERESH